MRWTVAVDIPPSIPQKLAKIRTAGVRVFQVIVREEASPDLEPIEHAAIHRTSCYPTKQ